MEWGTKIQEKQKLGGVKNCFLKQGDQNFKFFKIRESKVYLSQKYITSLFIT